MQEIRIVLKELNQVIDARNMFTDYLLYVLFYTQHCMVHCIYSIFENACANLKLKQQRNIRYIQEYIFLHIL